MELTGNASDILRDYVEGKYEIFMFKDTRMFIDTDTGDIYDLPEEVDYYLDILNSA